MMNLRQIRHKSGKTQAKVAQDTRIDMWQLSRYENGMTPPLDEMVTLEFYFDTEIEWPEQTNNREKVLSDLITLARRYPLAEVLHFANKALKQDIKTNKAGATIEAYRKLSDKVNGEEPLLPPEVEKNNNEKIKNQ